MTSEDDENIISLKESLAEAKQEHASLYELLPPEHRVHVQNEAREFNRRLRCLAEAKGFYEGDRKSHEKLKRTGRMWTIGAFAALLGFGIGRNWGVFEFSLRAEFLFYLVIALAGASKWFGCLLSQQTLALSARRYCRDEGELEAYGAVASDRRQLNAVLQYVNELIDDDGEQFSYEEKQLQYVNLKLSWGTSTIEDRLTALGIER